MKSKTRNRTAYMRAYRLSHITHEKQRAHIYYLRHRTERLAYNKKYKALHRRERALQRNAYRNRLRLELLYALGNKCLHCGFADKRALQVDHKKGGGNAERRKDRRSNDVQRLRFALTHLSRYQLLCANCNWIKRAELNEINKPVYV